MAVGAANALRALGATATVLGVLQLALAPLALAIRAPKPTS